MQGFTSELQTPLDLLRKLKWNLENFEANPLNVYVAFDFFVTAEHLPDWLGKKQLRSAYENLKVVSHIANGAKHFVVDRHDSVQALSISISAYNEAIGNSEKEIQVEFSLEKGNLSGLQMGALQLAKDTYDFWEEYLSADG